MDVRAHNREAWDRQVEAGNRWTLPVSPEQVEAARAGDWSVVLTPTKPVPRDWFPPLPGADVLCLASAGGQQAPLLAAAGASVTVFDNSPRQLERDRQVAHRDGLDLRTLEGDMRDLSPLDDASFDLVFHPVSNVFVPDVRAVWREAYRVLRPGGVLLAGFCNPVLYLFDPDESAGGPLVVRYALPYSDVGSLDPQRLRERMKRGEPLEWSHTFEDQIAGQLDAGFVITRFFEDADPTDPTHKYIPGYFATRSRKPRPEADRVAAHTRWA